MRSILAALAILAGAQVATPASACRFGSESFYLTTTAPSALPKGALVADVEVVSVDRPSLSRFIITTTVRSIIAGDTGIETIVIDPNGVSSCDQIPHVGDHGIIAATIRSLADGIATVEPVRSRAAWSDDVFPCRKQLGVGRIIQDQRP